MINWKLRFMNKATLAAIIGEVIAFVYQMLGIFGVVPKISEDVLTQFVSLALTLLVGFGVIVDPTTAGVGDSVQAMTYDEPR